jgi:hypothetical protein
MAHTIKGMLLEKAKMAEGLSWMSSIELFIVSVGFFGFVGADAKVVAAGFFEGVET